MTKAQKYQVVGNSNGLWYAVKRQQQTAADQAALSGALERGYQLVYPTSANNEAGNLCDAARRAAGYNGFSINIGDVSCPTKIGGPSPKCIGPGPGLPSKEMCVNVPPQLSGSPHKDDPKSVEVVLWHPLSSISFFVPNVKITTRAVATFEFFPPPCIAVLGPGQNPHNNGINIEGTAHLDAPDCALYSNVDSSSSILISGNPYVNVAGFYAQSGLTINGNPDVPPNPPILSNSGIPITDPFSCYSTDQYSRCAGVVTLPDWPASSPAYTPQQVPNPPTSQPLLPGVYDADPTDVNKGGMSFTSAGTTYLCPGLYIVDGETQHNAAFLVTSGMVEVANTANGMLSKCTVSDASGNLVNVSDGVDGVTIVGTSSSGQKGGGIYFNGGDVQINAPTVSMSVTPITDQTTGHTVFQMSSGCTPNGTGAATATGCIPAGVLFYQPCRAISINDEAKYYNTGCNTADNNGDSTIVAGSNTKMTGVVYTPLNNVDFTGHASSNCFEIIEATATLSGTASFTNAGCVATLTRLEQ